jgi:hypothetical protein
LYHLLLLSLPEEANKVTDLFKCFREEGQVDHDEVARRLKGVLGADIVDSAWKCAQRDYDALARV